MDKTIPVVYILTRFLLLQFNLNMNAFRINNEIISQS